MLDRKEPQGRLGQQGTPAPQDQQDHKVRWVQKGTRVIPELKVLWDHKVRQVLQDLQVLKVLKEESDPKEQ